MKISKSKRQLAQLLIEAGVKQFPDGGNYATQDASGLIYCYVGKPFWVASNKYWSGESVALMANADAIVHNHHQTCLNRAEFDQIVAESAEQSKPDADGWIEWKGGACPVDDGVSVEVKRERFIEVVDNPEVINWVHYGTIGDIIAYRLHKPEQTEPPYNLPETIDCRCTVAPIPTPTLDQLLQNYRNAADFAATKQAEADEAAKMRDDRWKSAQARACELGVRIVIGLAANDEVFDSEMVITDWRDLRVGDVIEYVSGAKIENVGLVGKVVLIDHNHITNQHVMMKFCDVGGCGWPTKWRFIRRP